MYLNWRHFFPGNECFLNANKHLSRPLNRISLLEYKSFSNQKRIKNDETYEY